MAMSLVTIIIIITMWLSAPTASFNLDDLDPAVKSAVQSYVSLLNLGDKIKLMNSFDDTKLNLTQLTKTIKELDANQTEVLKAIIEKWTVDDLLKMLSYFSETPTVLDELTQKLKLLDQGQIDKLKVIMGLADWFDLQYAVIPVSLQINSDTIGAAIELVYDRPNIMLRVFYAMKYIMLFKDVEHGPSVMADKIIELLNSPNWKDASDEQVKELLYDLDQAEDTVAAIVEHMAK